MNLKKINLSYTLFSIIILLLIILITLEIQNRLLEKRVIQNIEEASLEISSHLNDIENQNSKLNLLLTETKENVEFIKDYQKNEITNIQNDLVAIKNKSDAQFSKTISMKKTYDELLEEQKKKTVDITAKDNSVIQNKKAADDFYSKNEFVKAYELYKKVLEYQHDDMDARKQKIKSLYYANKADSSNYTEILDEINILKQNQILDDECLEIETNIIFEREGINE